MDKKGNNSIIFGTEECRSHFTFPLSTRSISRHTSVLCLPTIFILRPFDGLSAFGTHTTITYPMEMQTIKPECVLLSYGFHSIAIHFAACRAVNPTEQSSFFFRVVSCFSQTIILFSVHICVCSVLMSSCNALHLSVCSHVYLFSFNC